MLSPAAYARDHEAIPRVEPLFSASGDQPSSKTSRNDSFIQQKGDIASSIALCAPLRELLTNYEKAKIC
jgi:hypothetical protein